MISVPTTDWFGKLMLESVKLVVPCPPAYSIARRATTAVRIAKNTMVADEFSSDLALGFGFSLESSLPDFSLLMRCYCDVRNELL